MPKGASMRTGMCLLAMSLALAGGCQSAGHSSSADSSWERRAALLRGATDASWRSVKQAIDDGQAVDPRYVYALSELRTGAISAELKLAMAERFSSFESEGEEAKVFIQEAEPALTKLLAKGPAARDK